MLASMKLLHRGVIRAAIGCVFALALSGAAFSQEVSLSCPATKPTTVLVPNSTVFEVLSASTCVVGSGVTLTVPNTTENLASDLANGSPGTIINNGSIINGGNFVANFDGLNTGGTVDNFGTLLNNFKFDNTAGTLTNFGTVTNFGTLYSDFGTVNNAGTLTNAGTFYAGQLTNANLTNTAQLLNTGTLDVDGSLTNNATLTNFSGGTIVVPSQPFAESPALTITNNGTLSNSGTLTLSYEQANDFSNNSGATFTNQRGGVTNLEGTFVNAAGATFTNQAGSTLNITTGVLESSGVVTNNGTIALTTPSNEFAGGMTISNGSSLTNNGSITINGGIVDISGALSNSAGSTYVQMTGTTIVEAGGTLNSVPTVQIQGGGLTGNGTINGNVNNTGGVVGIVLATSLLNFSFEGDPTINGNYTQGSGGGLVIGLYGSGLGSLDGELNVSGLATLGGTAFFDAQAGFMPEVGDDFTFLLAGSLSGTFANFDLAGWNCPTGDACDLVYGANSVSLDITAASSGGSGSGNTPEPSSLLLLSVALLALIACSRAKRVAADA